MVGGWETVVAAMGGLLLGMGLGMGLFRGRERELQRALDDHASGLRRTVIPVLEDHAQQLGLPESERAPGVDDPLELTVALASAIQTADRPSVLPFSDTIQAPRASLTED